MSAGTHNIASDGLHRLAQAAGLMVHWDDAFGAPHEVNDDILRTLLSAMELPAGSMSQINESLRLLEEERQAQSNSMLIADQGLSFLIPWSGSPAYRVRLESGKTLEGVASPAGSGMVCIAPVHEPGYHVLGIGDSLRKLAICPDRCPSVAPGAGRDRPESAWGLAAQIYSLRGMRPGEGGDFTLLARLAQEAAKHGADAVAISPVHAMFSAAPELYSPYSPSNRLFLNAAYIDPAQAWVMAEATDHIGTTLERHGKPFANMSHIDWQKAQPERLRLLRHAYENFPKNGGHPLAAEMLAFKDGKGQALLHHALFETLHALHAKHLGPGHGWQDWAPSLRNPASAAIAAFAKRHAEEVDFHVFLQWLAHRGMQAAQQSALDAGMSIGLIADLAIGTDPRGSHAWSSQAEILSGVSLGAPPDLHQPTGQNWGLTAMSPRALRRGRYAAFVDLLRAALALAGGLRIDHILGLMRMWVIAPGASAADGAYLRYPMKDMLRLLTLEAWRNDAIVIGENLGTVPAGLNEQLAAKGVLGMDVLWFQRLDSEAESDAHAPAEPAFAPPSSWPPTAVCMTTTHDLPTVAGWWKGRDLYWRNRLIPDDTAPDAEAAQAKREEEKTALWSSMQSALSGLPAGPATSAKPPDAAPIASILRHVASAPCPLFIAPLEDLLGMQEQPNFPGGHKDYPSWMQILPLGVDTIFKDDAVLDRIAAIRRGRGTP